MRKKKINHDTDEASDGISYEKGRDFEISFSQFMKEELGWTKVRVGAHLSGKENQKGSNVDIIGEKLDQLGIKYKSYANKWMLSSGGLAFLSLLWHIEKWGEHGIVFLIFFLVVLAVGVLFRILSDIYNTQNSWVECKNLKGRANINHISKMIREMKDHKASKNDSHRFTHFYFASANGYVENALKLATDNGIICYMQDKNGFKEVKYWG